MKKTICVLLLLISQGCASVINTGHPIPVEYLAQLKEGVSTPDDVLNLYGKPENVTENTLDNTLIFTYHWMTVKSVSIGFPPFFMTGRTTNDGFKLNIAFIDDVYMGYELTTLDQHLGWREGTAEYKK